MNTTSAILQGIVSAMVTPFDADGQLHLPALKPLVEFMTSKGVQGLFVGGSTGEAFSLTVDERKALSQAVMKEAGDKLPVVVHVGAMDHRDVGELSRHAKSIGATAVSSVLPFYYQYPIDEIADYYRYIAQESGLPVIVYVFSNAGGLPCPIPQFAQRVLDLPGVVGLKYTGPDPFLFWSLGQATQKNIERYGGDDRCMLPMLVNGASAMIGTNYGCTPEPFAQTWRCFKANDMQGAIHAFDHGLRLLHALSSCHSVSRAKEILRLRGVDVGQPRQPLPRLSDAQKDLVRQTLVQFKLL